jgi:hypothetical protein
MNHGREDLPGAGQGDLMKLHLTDPLLAAHVSEGCLQVSGRYWFPLLAASRGLISADTDRYQKVSYLETKR